MQKIASFTINHDYLDKGMYISRIDGDVVTYDLRMKKPNNPENDYLDDNALHTFEHLFATYVRNTPASDSVVYVGPMGCRTGFYFLTRDTLSGADAIKLTQDALKYIATYEGDIPGAKRWECGNYRAHDLPAAKKLATDYFSVLKNWTAADLTYPPAAQTQPT